MRSRRGLRNPLNRFYLLALLGPLVMLSGVMLHGPVTNPVQGYEEAGMQALFFRLFLLVYWALAVIGPILLVVSGLALPLIGAIHVRERLVGRVRRGNVADRDLWPIYATALCETLMLATLFTQLISAGS